MGDPRDTRTLDKTEEGEPESLSRHCISLLLYHRDGTEVVDLELGVPVIIGRAKEADVVVKDSKFSRAHARFLWTTDGVHVEDLGSTNGTFLNGERIDSSRVLYAGDEVLIGSVAISLHVLTTQEQEAHTADGYDVFSERLRIEIVRSGVFQRPIALMMLRVVSADPAVHVKQYLPHVKAQLRPVDITGFYGAGHVIVALPETPLERALDLARAIIASMPVGSPDLVIGVVAFPSTAGSVEELVAAARSAARKATIESPVQGIDPVGCEGTLPRVVVVNADMRKLFETARRVARSMAPVLILGETGSGKELVARAIHDESPRKTGPLRTVNCGAISSTLIESTLFGHERGAFTGAERQHRGLFEQASGGTVFLDEVGELAPEAQAALLRVLETKRITRIGSSSEVDVDVRVIAATNRDLDEMVGDGGFREDLLYRLNAITLEIPPLRRRPEDIEPLTKLFAVEAARLSELPVRTVDEDTIDYLRAYDWPGNVRELRNVIERAVAVAEGATISPEDLPHRVRGDFEELKPADSSVQGMEFKQRIRLYEKELIREALKRAGNNQTQAAKLLRIPLRTLVHKLRTLDLVKSPEE